MEPKKTSGLAAPAKSALDRPAASFTDLKALLSRADVLESIRATLPKHMKPERLAKILLATVNKTPDLMKVNQLSLIQSLQQLSELGLEPGGAWGHVYLIPFNNRKEGRTDVNVIIGYRGLIELARRSGTVEQIEANVVFDGEVFEWEQGLSATRKFRHVPSLDIDRTDESKARAVYCIARLKGGGEHLEVMGMSEVRRIMSATQSRGNYGPWKEHFLQMARKTVIRRACNYLPLSAEIREALELEEAEPAVVGAGSTMGGGVSRPSAPVIDIGDQIATANANRPAANPEPEDAELGDELPPHNETTGELLEPPADEPAPDVTEDPSGNLLWRINRATLETLPALTEEATRVPKSDPNRGAIGAAISRRRAELRTTEAK